MVENTERTLETTDTSINVLETIRELEGASLATLQERMDVPKSTLYYHLNTLERRGYLDKAGTEYNLGMKFLVFGQYVKTREREYVLAQETTQQFAAQIDEDVDFSVEENGQLIVLHHVLGESVKHGFSFELGRPLNIPTTAAGKAILSEYPRSSVDEIVSRWGFEGTENAPSDRETLHDRLEAVRERGYAINNEEWIEGLCSVSSPVCRPDGSVLGALSIIIPSFRFDPENLDGLTTPLLNATAELEERLAENQTPETGTTGD